MASKQEHLHTLGILLSLEPAHKKDLSKLSPDTLEYIVEQYIENARKTNIKMVDEHINTNLPIVGPYILVQKDGEFIEAKRESFVPDKRHRIEFITREGERFSLPANRIKWKYS